MKNKVIYFCLFVSLLIGFWLRLKDIKAPLADWHSWRQADTASVAREYVKHGVDLLRPRYQDLSNVASGIANPEGYRMVEFPLMSGFVAWIYRSIPMIQSNELHVVYRFVNSVFSLISAFLLFLIMRKVESSAIALLTAATFLFLPYSIYYSRAVLPEVAMVTMSLAAIYFCIRFAESNRVIDALALIIFAALSLLQKPFAIFLLLPLLPYILSRQGKKALSPKWLILAILSVLPFFAWRQWILKFPEGIPASSWLFNGDWKLHYPEGIPPYAWIYTDFGIRFKGAFFQWIFADRIGRLILGYWGLIPLGIGLIAPKKNSMIQWWIAGSLLYVSVIAYGNVQHDYYQIPIIPVISILVAYGIQYIWRLKVSIVSKSALLMTSIGFMLMFSWFHVRAYYSITNPAIVSAGKAVDQLTPESALIIAPYSGDTSFLYQTNRRGWPVGSNVDERIGQGASYYVSTTQDEETKSVASQNLVILQTEEFTLIKLNKFGN